MEYNVNRDDNYSLIRFTRGRGGVEYNVNRDDNYSLIRFYKGKGGGGE